MKKYLLLASTALLFSTNAMATTYPDIEGQSTEITASAQLIPVCAIHDYENDISFGTLYVLGDFYADINASGTVTAGSNAIFDAGSSTHAASLSSSCTGEMGVNLELSCKGEGSISDGCNIGDSDYKIKPVASWTGDTGVVGIKVYGRLEGPRPDAITNISETAVVITLDY